MNTAGQILAAEVEIVNGWVGATEIRYIPAHEKPANTSDNIASILLSDDGQPAGIEMVACPGQWVAAVVGSGRYNGWRSGGNSKRSALAALYQECAAHQALADLGLLDSNNIVADI